MPSRPRRTFAVETDRGWYAVLAYRAGDIRAWMFAWFVIYDSDGRVVRRSEAAS